MKNRTSVNFAGLAVATMIAAVAIGCNDSTTNIVGRSKNSRRKMVALRATEANNYSFVCPECQRENIVATKPKKKALCKFCGK